MSTVYIDKAKLISLVEELVDCQKMVDYGRSNWAEKGDRFVKIQVYELPDAINRLLATQRTHLKAELLAKSITVDVPDDGLQDMVEIKVVPVTAIEEL